MSKPLLVLLVALYLAPAPRACCQTTDLNLDQTLDPIRAQLGAGQTVSILVLGDSLTFRDNTWYGFFNASLRAAFGDAGDGYQGFSLWTGAGIGEGWSGGLINSDATPHHSLDGLWSSTSAGPFPPLHSGSVFHARSASVRLHYTSAPGNGSFMLTFPDGSTQVIASGAPAPAVSWFAHDFPDDRRDILIQPLGDGAVTILGEDNRSGAAGVLLHRAANGGWGVNNFLARDSTFDAQLALLHPDLVMILLGQNDQGSDRAGYALAMGALVDRVRASAPAARFLLIGTYDSGSPVIPLLVGGMEDLARARALGFLSLYEVAGTHEYFVAHTYLEDGLHFTAEGGQYVAGFLTRAFMNPGPGYCAPVINHQPVGRRVRAGQAVRLSVEAAAGRSPMIAWRKGGVGLSDGGNILGSSTEHLTILVAATTDSGVYDAVISNACAQAVSVPANVEVLPTCAADFNGDGAINSQDFFDFLGDFFSPDQQQRALADVNGDGAVDSQDFFDFVIAFFMGC